MDRFKWNRCHVWFAVISIACCVVVITEASAKSRDVKSVNKRSKRQASDYMYDTYGNYDDFYAGPLYNNPPLKPNDAHQLPPANFRKPAGRHIDVMVEDDHFNNPDSPAAKAEKRLLDSVGLSAPGGADGTVMGNAIPVRDDPALWPHVEPLKVPRRDRYPNFKYLGWHPWAKMNRRMRENGAMGAIENQAQDALAQQAVGELKNKLPKGKSGYVDVMMEEYDGPPEMSNEGPNKNQVPRLDNPQGPSQLYEDRGIVGLGRQMPGAANDQMVQNAAYPSGYEYNGQDYYGQNYYGQGQGGFDSGQPSGQQARQLQPASMRNPNGQQEVGNANFQGQQPISGLNQGQNDIQDGVSSRNQQAVGQRETKRDNERNADVPVDNNELKSPLNEFNDKNDGENPSSQQTGKKSKKRRTSKRRRSKKTEKDDKLAGKESEEDDSPLFQDGGSYPEQQRKGESLNDGNTELGFENDDDVEESGSQNKKRKRDRKKGKKSRRKSKSRGMKNKAQTDDDDQTDDKEGVAAKSFSKKKTKKSGKRKLTTLKRQKQQQMGLLMQQ